MVIKENCFLSTKFITQIRKAGEWLRINCIFYVRKLSKKIWRNNYD